MNLKQQWTRAEAAAVTGLVASAAGIGVLWASGIAFPVYPPPGIILMLTGAVLFTVLRTRRRWASLLPLAFGLFIQIGFVVEGLISGRGFANVAGDAGTGAMIGQIVQQLGAITAIIGGVIATRARFGRTSQRTV